MDGIVPSRMVNVMLREFHPPIKGQALRYAPRRALDMTLKWE